jgi:dihydrodipicolinate synthase/N-acetylneuraminate lyase
MSWRGRLVGGVVIPAHPLALTAERKLDERRQRALTRYYIAAGAGGVAVGVHTTQFQIHDASCGLLRPVLELALEELSDPDLIRVAGLCGGTPQAVREAETAATLGYHVGLLSLASLREASVPELIDHVKAVAQVIPVMGFYLQPSVGGRLLPYEFWRQMAEVAGVVAIKVAPFNRYQTIDVLRGVAESGRAGEIALYTGNDDNIVADLLTRYERPGVRAGFVGGLLGQWAVWTRSAVNLLQAVRRTQNSDASAILELLALGQQLTDANAAIFDVANQFHGCVPGIHEVLRRQGLLAGRWCLDPNEDLSPGQAEEIDRVLRAYPHLIDDDFVREHLDGWLS